MSKSSTRRIGIFVDVQNIYYTTRHAYQRQFNYRKLWEDISARGEIVVAMAYATDRGDAGQLKFQEALRHIGFTVKLKPYIQRRDGSAKADWDVGITIDMLDHAAELDNITLLSGDGDFDLLVEKVRRDYQVTVDVYGVPDLTADALIRAADVFRTIDARLLM